MNYHIRLAKPSDQKQYTDLFQQTYESAYVNPKIGLTKECFSQQVFNTDNTQTYLKSKLITSPTQKTWLVFDNKQLIASATCKIIDENQAEFSGYYVLPSFQHQGIGKTLYQKVLKFSGNRDLLLGIYTHNTKSLKIYKKWGWQIDINRGENGYITGHWNEWPDGVTAKSVYLILKRNNLSPLISPKDEHQIMDLMNPIKYGWIDKFRVKHHQVDQNFSDNYRLQNPEQVLKSKLGICWDQVELERFLFNQINFKIKTFFIVHYDNDKYPTHTFLVFQKNKSYFWFEHSWAKHQGIHKFNNLKELLSDVKAKFISDELHHNFETKNLCIYEYLAPKFGISPVEFFHHCEHGKPIKI